MSYKLDAKQRSRANELLELITCDPESFAFEIIGARDEIRWLRHLVATIRDKGGLQYGKNKGLLAFSDLKDEALRTLPNDKDHP